MQNLNLTVVTVISQGFDQVSTLFLFGVVYNVMHCLFYISSRIIDCLLMYCFIFYVQPSSSPPSSTYSHTNYTVSFKCLFRMSAVRPSLMDDDSEGYSGEDSIREISIASRVRQSREMRKTYLSPKEIK